MGIRTRHGVAILAAVVTVGAAYFLGWQAAVLWDKKSRADRRQEYRSQALAQSRAILDRMGTVEIGDTLSDFSFEDIDGNLHRLSEILVDNTLLIYIKPECDACLEEVARLSRVAQTQDDYRHFILVSTANPLHLRKLRDDHGLQCHILYDEERFFGNNLNISSFPFGLLLDGERVILNVYAIALSERELIQLAAGEVQVPVVQ